MLEMLGVATLLAIAAGVVGRWLPLASLVVASTLLLATPGILAAARRRAGAGAALVVSVVLGPLVATATWLVTHPVLHVDNALGVPIDVWIDGRRWMTLPPSSPAEEPPQLRLPFGTHRFAWASAGSPAGLHDVEGFLGPTGEHLYSPGYGCYWFAVTAYGDASTHETTHGPLPVSELMKLDRVDVWFGDAPAAIDAPLATRGALRFALQRNRACMDLAALGCDADQREAYVECVRTIDAHNEQTDCFAEARRVCRRREARAQASAQPREPSGASTPPRP